MAITEKIEELNGIGAGNTESNKLAANLGLAKRLTEGLRGVSELKAALAKSDEKAAEMAKKAIMEKIEELKDIGDRKRGANLELAKKLNEGLRGVSELKAALANHDETAAEMARKAITEKIEELKGIGDRKRGASLELAKRLSEGLRGLRELKAALANHDENAAGKAKKAITDRIKALEEIGDLNGERGPNLELAKRLRGLSELKAALANFDENAAGMAEEAIAKIRELQEDIGEGNGEPNKLAANLELAIKSALAKSDAAKYAETAITARIKELEDFHFSDHNRESGGSIEKVTRLIEGLRGANRELKEALGTHDENAAEMAEKAITNLRELQDIGARNGEPNTLAADLELEIKVALAKSDENAAKYAETAIREKIEELEDIGDRNSERGPNLELAKRLTDGLSELKAAQAKSGENVAEAKKVIAKTIKELKQKHIGDSNGEPNRLAANLEQAIQTALANPSEYVTEKTKKAIMDKINELKAIGDSSGEPNKLAANLEQAIKAALANPAEYVAEAQKAITEKINELEDIGDREHGANLELATRLTEGLSNLKAALANPDENAAGMAEKAEKAIMDKIKELQDIDEGNGEPNKLAANLELAIKAALAKSDAAKYAKTAITEKIKQLKDMGDVGDGEEPNSKLAASLDLAKTLEEGLRKVQLAQVHEGVQTLLKNTALAKMKKFLHIDTFSNLADTSREPFSPPHTHRAVPLFPPSLFPRRASTAGHPRSSPHDKR